MNNLKFKIDELGYLNVSYDGGCSWESIGPVKGEGSSVPGPEGPQGPAGAPGRDGSNGSDGVTPYISETTGTWIVNGHDTGIIAAGKNGEIEVEESDDLTLVGTPSVSSRVDSTGKTLIKFHQLKGEPGEAPTLTAAKVGDTVTLYINDEPVVSISDGKIYTDGDYIQIVGDQINCTLVAGEGIAISPNGEISCTNDVPRTEHELIYYSSNKEDNGYRGLFAQQLMMTDGLVVNTSEDLETCMDASNFSMEQVANTWTRHNFNNTDPILGSNPSSYAALGTVESAGDGSTSAINAWHYVNKQSIDKRLYNGVTQAYSGNLHTLSTGVVQDFIYNFNNPNVYTFLRSRKKYSTYYSKLAIGVDPSHNLSGYTDRIVTIPALVEKNSNLYQIEIYTNNYNDNESWIGSGTKTVGVAVRKAPVPFTTTYSGGTGAIALVTKDEGLGIIPYVSSLDNMNPGHESAMILETTLFNNILTIAFSDPYSNAHNSGIHDDEVVVKTACTITVNLLDYTVAWTDASGVPHSKNYGLTGAQNNATVREVFDALANTAVNRAFMQESTPGCVWRNVKNLDGNLILDFTDGVETVYKFNGTSWDNLHTSPYPYFTGSRIAYNEVINKLYYSDGYEVIEIGSKGAYSPGDNISIEDGRINALGYSWDSLTGTFTVPGKINAPQGFFQTSDIRKKDIIEEISLDKAYALVDKCQEILYTLKDKQDDIQVGLIAQEVQEFFPELVSNTADGTLSLDYSRLTVIILRVLKDVIIRVQHLEMENRCLR